MQITYIIFLSDSALISLSDGVAHIAFFPFSKKEARRILLEYAENDPNMASALADANQGTLPEMNSTPTKKLEGTAVKTLCGMCAFGAHTSGGRAIALIDKITPCIYSLFLSDDEKVTDGLVGYCNEKGAHTISVFYSKEQANHIVRNRMHWLSGQHRQSMLDTIYGSHLPQSSTRPGVHITGQMAKYLNCAYALKEAATQQLLGHQKDRN